MSEIRDVVIIGSDPAGYIAALDAERCLSARNAAQTGPEAIAVLA
ncbi:hypothetical protein ACWC9H_12265 [Streptomyces sp. NPDC001251]